MVSPPVVQPFAKLVVEEGVTVLVVCAGPEQHLRLPVAVVVTGVDELKLAAEVERIVAHQEPMGRPLGTCGKLASIDWLLQAQRKKAVPECVLVALVEHEIWGIEVPSLRWFVLAIRTHHNCVNGRTESAEERLTARGVGLKRSPAFGVAEVRGRDEHQRPPRRWTAP